MTALVVVCSVLMYLFVGAVTARKRVIYMIDRKGCDRSYEYEQMLICHSTGCVFLWPVMLVAYWFTSETPKEKYLRRSLEHARQEQEIQKIIKREGL